MKNPFFKVGINLTDEQTNKLVHMLTKGCRDKAKSRIRSLVTYDLDTMIKNVSWFDRFHIAGYDNDVHYNAGQCYPSEIRLIRNEMLKRYP